MSKSKRSIPAKAEKPMDKATFKRFLLGKKGPMADANDEKVELSVNTKFSEIIQTPRESAIMKSFILFFLAINGRNGKKLWPSNWQDLSVSQFSDAIFS